MNHKGRHVYQQYAICYSTYCAENHKFPYEQLRCSYCHQKLRHVRREGTKETRLKHREVVRY